MFQFPIQLALSLFSWYYKVITHIFQVSEELPANSCTDTQRVCNRFRPALGSTDTINYDAAAEVYEGLKDLIILTTHNTSDYFI